MSNIKKQILKSEPLCKLLAYWLLKKAAWARQRYQSSTFAPFLYHNNMY